MPAVKKPEPKSNGLDTLVKLATPLLAIATLVWGIYTYGETFRRSEGTRRIEAAKGYLDKQLALYSEATRNAAILATETDDAKLSTARQRFLELYFGELGMVERFDVAKAMGEFKSGMDRGILKVELQKLALNLAHACRDELAASWGTDAWLLLPGSLAR